MKDLVSETKTCIVDTIKAWNTVKMKSAVSWHPRKEEKTTYKANRLTKDK